MKELAGEAMLQEIEDRQVCPVLPPQNQERIFGLPQLSHQTAQEMRPLRARAAEFEMERLFLLRDTSCPTGRTTDYYSSASANGARAQATS